MNKQEFSASSWRSNQGYTKMYGQPTIKNSFSCRRKKSTTKSRQYTRPSDRQAVIRFDFRNLWLKIEHYYYYFFFVFILTKFP